MENWSLTHAPIFIVAFLQGFFIFSICLQVERWGCFVGPARASLCPVPITMKTGLRCQSSPSSGGVPAAGCCVTTSNTKPSRTAAPDTPSATGPPASGCPSCRFRRWTLALTSALSANATSSLTSAWSWTRCAVGAEEFYYNYLSNRVVDVFCLFVHPQK